MPLRERPLTHPVLVLDPRVRDPGRSIAGAGACRPVSGGFAEALEVEVQVAVGHLLGCADGHDLAALQQHCPVAEALDRGHVVSHEEDGLALVAHLEEHVEALLLERGIAHGQDLVDEHDVGPDLDHHREGEADVHARRVVLELEVHELLELGEAHDLVEALARLARAEAVHDPVHHHVVARRQLGVEAHAQLDERGHGPVGVDLPGVDPVDAGQALEQAALARSVAAHDAEELTALHAEGHVVQGLEAVHARAADRMKHTLLERVAALVGHHEALGHVVHDHGRGSARGGTHAENGTGGFSRLDPPWRLLASRQ